MFAVSAESGGPLSAGRSPWCVLPRSRGCRRRCGWKRWACSPRCSRSGRSSPLRAPPSGPAPAGTAGDHQNRPGRGRRREMGGEEVGNLHDKIFFSLLPTALHLGPTWHAAGGPSVSLNPAQIMESRTRSPQNFFCRQVLKSMMGRRAWFRASARDTFSFPPEMCLRFI